MKTVLVIGAGGTRAQAPKAAIKRLPPLDGDFFKIAKAIDPVATRAVTDCLETLVGDYADALCESLETAATYLYIKAIDNAAGSKYHTAFLDLLTLLNTVLGATTNSIRVAPRSLMYRFLLAELRKVDAPENLDIITFNYDLSIERTLLEISKHHNNYFSFPGCYRFPEPPDIKLISGAETIQNPTKTEHSGVSILKLHGSMNWHSKHSLNQPTPSAIFNPDRNLLVANSPFIPGSLSFRPHRREYFLKPIIIPPVSGKRGIMHNDILALWGFASEALQNADRIVFTGYSCPPLDLEARILISENMRSNPDKRVYVVDPCADVMGKFLELCGVNHVTYYSSLESWVSDARAYES